MIVDGKDTFAHAGEHGFKLIALVDDGFNAVVELGGHLVEGFGQSGHFFRTRCGQTVAEISVGKMAGTRFHRDDGTGDAAGYQQTDPGGKQGYR